MKTKYAVLTLTLALTACAAPEFPQRPGISAVAPLPGAPALPVEFAQADALPRAIQVAQSHNLKNDMLFSRGRGGRTLIIQTSEANPKVYANLEEDLSVMYRILTKTGKQEDSGFKLESMFSGSSGGSVRSMYLEGYGAVFMLNVRFPLVAPQGVEEEPKPKDTASEEWRKAKEELYARNTFELDLDRVWTKLSGPAEEYDAQKVEDVTTSVLEALKNATNIRNLKSDEFVTVAVLGAEARVQRVSVENDDDDGKVKRKARVEAFGSGLGESTMTIRVKKSDIDDFAKGKLDLDAFRKKARMLVYVRPGDAAGKMSVYAPPKPKAPERR